MAYPSLNRNVDFSAADKDGSYWLQKGYTELSIPEFLSLFDKPKSVEVKLDGEYTAIVTTDGIKVSRVNALLSSRTFPASIISELAEAHKKVTGGEG